MEFGEGFRIMLRATEGRTRAGAASQLFSQVHWRFEDYEVITGYTNVGHVPYASLREFFCTGRNRRQS
jgi:hypothetical protein